MKIKSLTLIGGMFCAMASASLSAHCQVPCGIYADDNVFAGMMKDVDTIEKAMTKINEGKESINQQVRWVNNKESHAQSIQDTVAKYFLAQRVKTTEAEKSPATYQAKLVLLHQITVHAMKCKQTTDLQNAAALKKAITSFKAAYEGKAVKAAAHGHTHAPGAGHKH